MSLKYSKKKTTVYHFSGGVEGGVHSVIKNIILNSNSSSIDYKVVYLINRENNSDIKIPINIPHSVVKYSKFHNLYYTVKKIKKSLESSNGILVCHDWLELAMVSSLGLSNPVVFFLHGDYDYYYDVAQKNEYYITTFIVPTSSMKSRLLNLIPHRENDIYIQTYPVIAPKNISLNFDTISCAYYVTNLKDPNKQFEILPEIDKYLIQNGVSVNWNIGGGGMDEKEFINKWKYYDSSRINFYGYLDAEKLSNLITKSNIFILPSFKEGIPISMVESMISGLVPIVYNWNSSIKEYIQSGINGYIIGEQTPQVFAEKIILLYNDKSILKKLSETVLNSKFVNNNIEDSISILEAIILKRADKPIVRVRRKLYGSRLDHPLINNAITTFIRKKLAG